MVPVVILIGIVILTVCVLRIFQNRKCRPIAVDQTASMDRVYHPSDLADIDKNGGKFLTSTGVEVNHVSSADNVHVSSTVRLQGVYQGAEML